MNRDRKQLQIKRMARKLNQFAERRRQHIYVNKNEMESQMQKKYVRKTCLIGVSTRRT